MIRSLTCLALMVSFSVSATAQDAKSDKKPADKLDLTKTTPDPNKQQIVPPLAKVPKPDKGYGTIIGQFVFDGPVPAKQLLHKKGDPETKDGDVCASEDQFKNDLVVNNANMGIHNIFIYQRKAKKVHPDLKKSARDFVVFDQKGCRFYPKSLLVRTDQKVRVLSGDNCAHNTRYQPVSGKGDNFLVPPNDRKGNLTPNPGKFKSQSVPTEVKCDLHPWMKAHWLILDHPYAAVSNTDGRFMIQNIPAGKHGMRIWHERVGYVHKKMGLKTKEFEVTVKDGAVLDLGKIKLKPEALGEKTAKK